MAARARIDTVGAAAGDAATALAGADAAGLAPSEAARNLSFDGVRGVAVLLVTLSHAHVPVMRFGGTVGLTVFFVLSGYLITSILAGELDRTSRIALGAFYARRALRLLPALVVAVVVGGALAVVAGPFDVDDVTTGGLFSLFYIANLSGWLDTGLGPFGNYWSLSMEEQYYLLWPMALLLLRRLGTRTTVAIILGIAAVSLVWRFSWPITTVEGYRRSFYLPQTNVWALLLGSALALLVARGWRPTLPPWSARAAAALVLFSASVMGMRTGLRETAEPATYVLRLTAAPIAAVGTLVIVYLAAQRAPSVRWLEHRWLVFFGTISYALYLWHAVLGHVVEHHIGSSDLRGLVAGSLAAVLATLVAMASMRFVERPFLRLKRRFAPRPVTNAASA